MADCCERSSENVHNCSCVSTLLPSSFSLGRNVSVRCLETGCRPATGFPLPGGKVSKTSTLLLFIYFFSPINHGTINPCRPDYGLSSHVQRNHGCFTVYPFDFSLFGMPHYTSACPLLIFFSVKRQLSVIFPIWRVNSTYQSQALWTFRSAYLDYTSIAILRNKR